MDGDKIKEVLLHSKQPDRRAKTRANNSIRNWVDYLHTVGGGALSDNQYSSPTGLSGISDEDDSESSSEETSRTSSSSSSLSSEGGRGAKQELLLKIWGPFIRAGNPNETREAKRPRIDNRDDKSRRNADINLGSSSEDNDSSSEGSDGSVGSLADFIC